MKKFAPLAPFALTLALAFPDGADAQDRTLLSRVQVVGGAANTCPAVFVSFNVHVTFADQSSEDGGRTLLIRLSRDAADQSRSPAAVPLETYPNIDLPGLGSVAVTLDANGSAPVLRLRFVAPVVAQTAQGGESSLVISGIHRVGADCGAPAPAASASASPGGAGQGPEADYFQARRLITAGDYARAIQLLTRFLESPPNDLSPDAQEMLGVARERNGQLAHARAEYEKYLRLYPDNPGAPRVRQRLAALTALARQPRSATAPTAATAPSAALPPAPPRRTVSAARPAPEAPKEPTVRGRISAFYLRNQGSTYFTEFDTDTSTDAQEVYQDALVTTVDFEGSKEGRRLKTSWRIAGDYEENFEDPNNSQLSISRAYIDWEGVTNGVGLRLGRQTRHDGGVFGRFDGLEFRFPVGNTGTVRTIIGSPAERSSDDPYETETGMAGISLGFEDLIQGLDFDFYAIAQEREGFTNRQAVGMDLQFQSQRSSVVAIIDYDVYFQTINLARVSGTRLGRNGSSFTVSADYTHSPLLTLGNALTGETYTTLTDLDAAYPGEIFQFAKDKTAVTSSVTLTWSTPITEKWQFSIDGTAFRTEATAAAGALPAAPATGPEYFGSIQFVGSNLFGRRDTTSLALRFADAESSDLALLDGYIRFDATKKLRLKPRLRYGHRVLAAGGNEDFVIPSINFAYKVNKRNEFELEIGGRYSNLDAPTYSQESNDIYVTAGFTRQF